MNKFIKNFPLILIFSFLIVGCNNPSPKPQPQPSPISEDYINPNLKSFDDFFTYSNKINVEIKANVDTWAIMGQYQGKDTDTKYHDIYFPCELTVYVNDVKAYNLKEVGMRMKGNTTRPRKIIDSSTGKFVSEPHLKLSFGETYDGEEYDIGPGNYYKHEWTDQNLRDARKDREMFDTEKIDFKYNATNDDTHLRQSYAYYTFESNGIIAPKDNLVNFKMVSVDPNSKVCDEKTSVYEAVECIDKSFLKRTLGKLDAKGDLYKCIWGKDGKANYREGHVGIEDNWNRKVYSYDLKTNKKDLPLHTKFNNFRNVVITKYSTVEEAKTKMDEVLDADQFLKMHAISYLLSNPDDQRFNYNNYYLYFNNNTVKAIYIPYDWDWCLGNVWSGQDNLLNKRPLSNTDKNGNQNSNYIYSRMFLDFNHNDYPVIQEYQEKYLSYVKQFKDSVLSDTNFKNFVRKFAVNDKNKENIDFLSQKLSKVNEQLGA